MGISKGAGAVGPQGLEEILSIVSYSNSQKQY
jgi:hypothetical protein